MHVAYILDSLPDTRDSGSNEISFLSILSLMGKVYVYIDNILDVLMLRVA